MFYNPSWSGKAFWWCFQVLSWHLWTCFHRGVWKVAVLHKQYSGGVLQAAFLFSPPSASGLVVSQAVFWAWCGALLPPFSEVERSSRRKMKSPHWAMSGKFGQLHLRLYAFWPCFQTVQALFQALSTPLRFFEVMIFRVENWAPIFTNQSFVPQKMILPKVL